MHKSGWVFFEQLFNISVLQLLLLYKHAVQTAAPVVLTWHAQYLNDPRIYCFRWVNIIIRPVQHPPQPPHPTHQQVMIRWQLSSPAFTEVSRIYGWRYDCRINHLRARAWDLGSPGAMCIYFPTSASLWTNWLAQKSNNRTPFGFRSVRPFLGPC